VKAADLEATHSRIPRESSWYQRHPFDASLTFQSEDGEHWRYLVTPTDERYLVEPRGTVPPGSLPPEEMEVRDHILAMAMLRRQVGFWGMVRGLLLRMPSEDFRAAQRAFARLRQLCLQSREHRAALLRLGHALSTPPAMAQQLLIMVRDVDAARSKPRP
jgi:hypothetical protein